MPKYMVLFSADKSAKESMAEASMDDMKASIAQWLDWQAHARPALSVEFGLSLQPVMKITSIGSAESTSKVSGYAFVEGASQAIIKDEMKTHPHLAREGASLDVFEMISMPGL